MLFRKMRLADYVFRAPDAGEGGGAEATTIDSGPSSRHDEFVATLDSMGVGDVDSEPAAKEPEPTPAPEPEPEPEPEPVAEEAKSDEPADEPGEEETAQVADDKPSDELIRLAKHYGVRDGEIEGQSARSLSQTLSAIGRSKFPHTSDPRNQPQPDQQPAPQQQQQPAPEPDPSAEVPKTFDHLAEHGYEPELIEALNKGEAAHAAELARRDEQIHGMQWYLQQQHQEGQQRQEAARVENQKLIESQVDDLGHTDRFGGVDLNLNTGEQNKNFEWVLFRVEEMQASGLRDVPLKELVRQAEFDLFGQQEMEQATQAKTRAVQAQSRKVSHRPATQKQAGPDEKWTGDPLDDPVIHKMHRQMRNEHGQT